MSFNATFNGGGVPATPEGFPGPDDSPLTALNLVAPLTPELAVVDWGDGGATDAFFRDPLSGRQFAANGYADGFYQITVSWFGEGSGAPVATEAMTAFVARLSASGVGHTGGLLDDAMIGGAGGDTFLGGAGNNLLLGLGGDDSLVGGDDAETLDGGEGADTLRGGAGDDDITVFTGDDQAFGGAGDDVVRLGGFAGDTAETRKRGAGGDGNDLVTGSVGQDSITGGAGDDALDGEDGADTLIGGGGFDSLQGGDGDDLLRGGAGGAVFRGGPGQDRLVADAADGAFDRFVLGRPFSGEFAPDPADGPDRILGFVSGEDAIELGFSEGAALVTTADPMPADGPVLVYDTTNGRLFYDLDGAGGDARTLIAVLVGAPALSGGDFLFSAGGGG
jgi:Ca2+-binding RTX toxin-like protein